jgi:thiamine-phosphate diphosphorylase
MISRLQYITSEMADSLLPQSVEEVCKGGCNWIQLRLKNKSDKDFLKIAFDIQEICKKFNAKLIINDNVEIAKEIIADGIHLGKTDMSPVDARKILGNSFIIGCTASTINDIIELSTLNIDYIGLGPFRYTTTKENLDTILGLEGFRTIMRECEKNYLKIPVIAIGGITINDIDLLFETGIYGIAMSSSINSSKSKQNQTRKIINKIIKNKYAKS